MDRQTNVADLIPKMPGLLAKYTPHLEYLLIDEQRYDTAQLAGMKNLVAAAIRFERPESPKALLELIDLLNAWLANNRELKRIFAIWIRAMVLQAQSAPASGAAQCSYLEGVENDTGKTL